MNEFAEFYEQAADDPFEIILSDLLRAHKAGDSEAVRRICSAIQSGLNGQAPLNFLNASKWLLEEPEAPDQIIENFLDKGDKLAIIGGSKIRKSFSLLQLVVSIVTGRSFLGLGIPKARRVAIIQLEIKQTHFHRRLKNMCRALDVSADDLGDRLLVLNGRGLGMTGTEGMERITAALEEFQPDVVAIDPLYKIASGVENAAEDVKIIMNAFDQLAETLGAAVAYVHHDAKGAGGDRDIRDRGAGSNVLGRDYDACITLTPHAQIEDVVVIDTLLRNYAPIESFAATWSFDESGYCFRRSDDVAPEKKTSKTKTQPALSTYLPVAFNILGDDELEAAAFRVAFKERSGLSDNRIKDFLAWAQSGGNPKIISRDERGRGFHRKYLRGNGNEF